MSPQLLIIPPNMRGREADRVYETSPVQIEGEESTFRLMPACFALCHAGTVVWQSSLLELSGGLLGHSMGPMNLRVAGVSVRSSLVGLLARSLA